MNPKSILITGANGGIGSCLVQAASQRWPEAKIFAVARDEGKLLRLGASLPHFKALAFDLTRPEDAKVMAEILKGEIDTLDLVIHTLGILNGLGHRPEKSLKEVEEAALAEAFQVNTMSAIWLGQAIKPFLQRKSGMSQFMILSAKVGSIGDNDLGGWYSYRMSKAALNMGIKTMALEFRRSSCPGSVVAVHPGTTLTDFSREQVKNWAPARLATAETTAKRLLQLAESLDAEHNGKFLHWDGSELPW
jgi:NAD(P)-dependent dehydrogenase (short-subunit alcohol dehydrogenase family)